MYDLVLPRTVGSYVVIGYSLLEVYITRCSVTACLLYLSGKKRKIVNYAHASLNCSIDGGVDIEVARVLSKMVLGWNYRYTRLVVTASNVLFKILNLPLFENEKMKLIVPAEIEQGLPFLLSECSIDSIVSCKFFDKKRADVLAIIMKNDVIAFYREIFKQAQIPLHVLTIDAVEAIVYELDQERRDEGTKEILTRGISEFYNAVVMLCNYEGIVVWIYKNGSLVAVKVIDETFATDVFSDIRALHIDANLTAKSSFKEQSVTEKNENKVVGEELILFDADKNKEEGAAKETDKKNFSTSTKEERVAGFIEVLMKQYGIDKTFSFYWIGVAESEVRIKKVAEMLKVSFLPHPFEFSHGGLRIMLSERSQELNHAGYEGKILTAASFLSDYDANFNLLIDEDLKIKKDAIKRQFFSGIFLTALLIFISFIWNFILLNKKVSLINEQEAEITLLLRKNFQLSGRQSESLERAIKESELITKTIESSLPPMAIIEKMIFLRVLNGFVGHLSNEIKGLEITTLQWKNGFENLDTFIMKGKVFNFDGLHLLEDALKSSAFFVMVPQAQDPKFSFSLQIKKEV